MACDHLVAKRDPSENKPGPQQRAFLFDTIISGQYHLELNFSRVNRNKVGSICAMQLNPEMPSEK
jgi:hypothetical protein